MFFLPMARYARAAVLLFSLALYLCSSTGCAIQRRAIPPGEVPTPISVTSQDEEYGQEVLRQLSEQFPLERRDDVVNRVRDVVDRLTDAAQGNGHPWHVYVFQAEAVKNAGATRGNFIFVWSGILSVVHSDAELATILAHEIGHLLAGHTVRNPAEEANEMISGVAGAIAREALARTLGPVAGLAGAIVQETMSALIVNPESQRKEYEADHIGLFLMAKAGYDPQIAVDFWRRVQDDPNFSGGELPQFLSTHPSSEDRSLKLSELLPEAEAEYQRLSGIRGTSPLQHQQDPTPNKTSVGESQTSAPPPQHLPFATSNTTSNTGSANGPAPERYPSQDPLMAITTTVGVSNAEVMSAADGLSSLFNSLQQGAHITIVCREGGWLKLSAPVAGFIRVGEVLRPSRTPPICQTSTP